MKDSCKEMCECKMSQQKTTITLSVYFVRDVDDAPERAESGDLVLCFGAERRIQQGAGQRE